MSNNSEPHTSTEVQYRQLYGIRPVSICCPCGKNVHLATNDNSVYRGRCSCGRFYTTIVELTMSYSQPQVAVVSRTKRESQTDCVG